MPRGGELDTRSAGSRTVCLRGTAPFPRGQNLGKQTSVPDRPRARDPGSQRRPPAGAIGVGREPRVLALVGATVPGWSVMGAAHSAGAAVAHAR